MPISNLISDVKCYNETNILCFLWAKFTPVINKAHSPSTNVLCGFLIIMVFNLTLDIKVQQTQKNRGVQDVRYILNAMKTNLKCCKPLLAGIH